MKKVWIKITGETEAGKVETSVEGTVETNAEGAVIQYTEQFEGDNNPTNNTLTVNNNVVELKKTGGVNVVMHFEAGKDYKAVYQTSVGPIEMHIKTESVFIKFYEKGLYIEMDYTLSFAPDAAGKNHIVLKAEYIS
ncbi:MAG: DUF1934 domain-containing protein [Eubacterium sp.]|nr:DUF1934 domain-containing protein [Eubacterium sp.]